MLKASKDKVNFVNNQELVDRINSGYTVKRVSRHTQKKTFAPSTVAYGHGECPRYWYIAFDGAEFSDNADA